MFLSLLTLAMLIMPSQAKYALRLLAEESSCGKDTFSFNQQITDIVAEAEAAEDGNRLLRESNGQRRLDDDLWYCPIVCANVLPGYCWIWAPLCVGWRRHRNMEESALLEKLEDSKIDNPVCDKMKADTEQIFLENMEEAQCLGGSRVFECFQF